MKRKSFYIFIKRALSNKTFIFVKPANDINRTKYDMTMTEESS